MVILKQSLRCWYRRLRTSRVALEHYLCYGWTASTLCLLLRAQESTEGSQATGSSRDLVRTVFYDCSPHSGTCYHQSCPLISGLVRHWSWDNWAGPWKPGACFLSNALAINMTLEVKFSCVSDSSFPLLIWEKQNNNKKHGLPAYAIFSMMWEELGATIPGCKQSSISQPFPHGLWTYFAWSHFPTGDHSSQRSSEEVWESLVGFE